MQDPLLTFSVPPGMQVPSCFSSSFSLLHSVLPGYLGVFLILFDVQGSLLVFSRCSVKIVPFVDVFFFFFNFIVLVLPYINMHLPRVYMCSPS